MSFARLIQRFKDSLADSQNEPRQQHDQLGLATAAVLLEIAYADGVLTPAEETDLVEYLRGRFQLDDEMVRELIKAADEIRTRTIDHFALTSFIRKNAPLSERIEIVKAMWRMV